MFGLSAIEQMSLNAMRLRKSCVLSSLILMRTIPARKCNENGRGAQSRNPALKPNSRKVSRHCGPVRASDKLARSARS